MGRFLQHSNLDQRANGNVEVATSNSVLASFPSPPSASVAPITPITSGANQDPPHPRSGLPPISFASFKLGSRVVPIPSLSVSRANHTNHLRRKSRSSSSSFRLTTNIICFLLQRVLCNCSDFLQSKQDCSANLSVYFIAIPRISIPSFYPTANTVFQVKISRLSAYINQPLFFR